MRSDNTSMNTVLMVIQSGTVYITTLLTFRGKPVALAYLRNTLNYNKMAQTAKPKKVQLHTDKQYEDLLAKVQKMDIELAETQEKLKERDSQLVRALEVAEKHKLQTDELINRFREENSCDNAATLRIIALITEREPSVRAVLLSNVLSVIKFRAEESVRRLESKHNDLIDQLEKARAASNDIFELVK
jgi:methionine-rich copper-binding protein CopC